MRFIDLGVTLFLTASNLSAPLQSPVEPQTATPMFTEEAMTSLKFLEGRWSGEAPDGSVFFEEYDFPDASTMRSRRYGDAGFAEVLDGSTVSLRDGKVTSTWGEFTWEAVSIDGDTAQFRPVNAPSSFSWRRVDANAVEVVQNWTDENGAPQRYSLILHRTP